MTPMQKAWLLLKMPIVDNSIQQTSDNRFEAQFRDPKTNKIYPMIAEENPKFGAMNVGIYPSQPTYLGTPTALDGMDLTDDDIDDDIIDLLGLGLSNAELSVADRYGDGHDSDNYWESNMTWTHPLHRRRGYATALYDLINQISPRQVRPSGNQSDEGKLFWSKRRLPE